MKEIVEDGRRRGELVWAKGSVRFDTDFIDGYDRRGEVAWQSGWADIARAEVKLQMIGKPVIVLTEGQGRKLEIPHTPESWAAVRFLLPSSAVLKQPGPTRRTNTPALGFLILGLVFGLAWLGLPMSLNRSDPLVSLLFAAGAAVALGISVALFILGKVSVLKWGKAAEQAHDAKTIWQIQSILDEQPHWFEVQDTASVFARFLLAFLCGTAVYGGILLLLTRAPFGFAVAFGIGWLLTTIFWCVMVKVVLKVMRTTPAATRLRISNGQAHLFLPGQVEPLSFQPTTSIFGKRLGSGRTAFWVRLDSFKMIQAPEE